MNIAKKIDSTVMSPTERLSVKRPKARNREKLCSIWKFRVAPARMKARPLASHSPETYAGQ